MKKILIAAAAILAANAWMVSSVKAFQNDGRAWLVQLAYYDQHNRWHPTQIWQFTDYHFSPYEAGYQCTLALKQVSGNAPFTYCSVNAETLWRLY